MFKVRSGVFETNSSSTHSICIQKKPVDANWRYITFLLGDYGWDEDEVDFANYLYTAIMCLNNNERNAKMKKLKSILDEHHIRYEFEEPEFEYFDGEMYLKNGYIDHSYDTSYFIDAVLNDEDMLLRGLFGEDSVVYTGNDNVWDDDDGESRMCNVAEEYDWEKDGDDWKRKKVGNWGHEYYNPDEFDYFYKGN